MTGSINNADPRAMKQPYQESIDDAKAHGSAKWAVESFIEADDKTLYAKELVRQATNDRTTEQLIEEREPQHGDFSKRASVAISFKFAVRQQEGWNKLSPAMQHSLDMIVEKISRILVGNPRHLDHWEDIAGYSKLVVKDLTVAARNPFIKQE